VLHNTLPLSCHANTLQEQEWYKAIYISPMLGSKLPTEEGLLKEQAPFPLRPLNVFRESAPPGYI